MPAKKADSKDSKPERKKHNIGKQLLKTVALAVAVYGAKKVVDIALNAQKKNDKNNKGSRKK